VLLQHNEDGVEVSKVIRPGGAVDEDVIKKHEHELA
jgi:hypothetical protein